jgi:FecR protein
MKLDRNRTGWIGSRFGSGILGLAVLSAVTVLLLPRALADDAVPAARAARLSSVDGKVQISLGSQVIADQAVANAPLFEGTRVATAEDGRAEIQFEDGSVARLSPNSALTLTVLSGQGGGGDSEIVLDAGLGYFELRGPGPAGKISVGFGDSVVTAGGFTVLRINLDNPPGEMAVFSGNAHLERGGAQAVDLHGGESEVPNGADPSHYDLSESIEPDSWDTWNSDRDQMLAAEGSSRTAATQGFADSSNPAWNDLDANGNWYNVPGQGNIWSPNEASDAGWDPYGSGYWMWTPRFGYVWVSGYSWGYLPFQCGNWNFYDNFGWGWAPGMGGCARRWGGGYYGLNIGMIPGGYRPPLRPRPRPRGPAGSGEPIGVHPMLAVNRHPSGGIGGLPLRDRSGTVVIAGHPVQAFRPLSPRPQYERTASGFVNRTVIVTPGTRTGTVAGPSYGTSRTGSSAGSYYGSRPPEPSGGNSASQHVSTPSRPPSGGYSGGGSPASHSSGGGGGNAGGGGAAHGGGSGGSHR